jgi:hypothetical protein
MGDGTLGGSAAPAFDERALEDCATRNPSRFGFAEAARRRLSDKSDRLLVHALQSVVAKRLVRFFVPIDGVFQTILRNARHRS